MASIRLGFLALLLVSGCAHVPTAKKEDPKYLFANACSPGQSVKGVKGSAWLRAKSKESSGQFPASLQVTAPDHLQMEVTNLLGATEAHITINGNSYKVDMPNRQRKVEDTSGYWGGIPLRWATDLFVGRIPCPESAQLANAKMSVTKDGDLVVEVPQGLEHDPERFTYKFRVYAGKEWPDSLKWERLGSVPIGVEFKFDDPEDKTDSPRKWEAKSDRGEVKVRWKDRELTLR